MVNVIDVDISFDNFKQTFGRTPTEQELSMLMKLQDKKNKAKKEIERRRALGMAEPKQKEPMRKPLISVSPRGMMINKMLKYGLEPMQIADVLNTTFEKVINMMTRYRLPRKNVRLVKPTDYK
jgi:hypothetical protein